MTEWDAAAYVRRSGLQEAMAREALALLDLNGNERVLDIGCGDPHHRPNRVTTSPRLDTGH